MKASKGKQVLCWPSAWTLPVWGYDPNTLNFSLLIIPARVFGCSEKKKKNHQKKHKKTDFDLINRKAISRGNDAAHRIYGKV